MSQPGKPRSAKAEARAPAVSVRPEPVCTVRIELEDTEPLIWREVEVSTSVTLLELHEIIQAAMGWLNYHLWEFTAGAGRYGVPTDEDWGTVPLKDAAKVLLRAVLEPDTTEIRYLYDFGDFWEHRLIVTNIRRGEPGVAYPRYIDGKGAAPPEDCGGIPGFYDKLAARTDPEHSDHTDIKEWLGDYDPTKINRRSITARLRAIANRRTATDPRPAKKRV